LAKSNTVYMNWIDSNSQVNEGVTVGRSTACFVWTIWCCLHLLNKFFNMHLIVFF